MEKTDVLSRLTFCGECGYWRIWDTKKIKEECRGYLGFCDRPHEGKVQRDRDDFCSRGVKKKEN